MRSLLAFAAALAPIASAYVQMGAAWNCAAQPGPFSVWINELHYMGAGADTTRAVEVAAVTGANVDYSTIDVLLIDPVGAVAARRNLAVTCQKTTLTGSNPVIDVFYCPNWVVTMAGDGGGIAVVNNRGTSLPADDAMIQYISVPGTASSFLGTAPCPLPADQAEHLSTPDGTSIQLVDGLSAGFDASLQAVDVYGFYWQGLLPTTWNGLNNGGSVWGDFAETFTPALLTAPYPSNPATLGVIPVDNATACTTSTTWTDWSPCSLPCAATAASTAAGVQTRYMPLIQVPTSGNMSNCQPLADRTESRACTPTAVCTLCSNLVQNSPETDIDCGGGFLDDFALDTSAMDQLNIIFNGYITNTSAPSVANPATAGNVTCGRCQMGRKCGVHADCDTSLGLGCINRVCTPVWLVNSTIAIDFNVDVTGMAPNELVGTALSVVQWTVAEVLSGPTPAAVAWQNVSLAAVAYFPHGANWSPNQAPGYLTTSSVNARLLTTAGQRELGITFDGSSTEHASRHISYSNGRRLSNVDDHLNVTVRVAADSNAEAIAIGQNLRANYKYLAALIAERLRVYSPLMSTILIGQPVMMLSPYAVSSQQAASGGSAGLATGAIVGIVVGGVALIALVAAGIIVASRRKETAPAARRAGMNIGETKPANAGPLTSVPPVGAHEKKSFAPTHPQDAESKQTFSHANPGPVTQPTVNTSAAATNGNGATAAKRGTPANATSGMTSP